MNLTKGKTIRQEVIYQIHIREIEKWKIREIIVKEGMVGAPERRRAENARGRTLLQKNCTRAPRR